MKKLTCLICLIMALVSPSALATDADTEPSLWPAYDPVTGLWGYIDAQGDWGIAPQYGYAGHFHSGCAVAGDASPGTGVEAQGIIDENGEFLLVPEYLIYDHCSNEDNVAYGVTEVFLLSKGGKKGWFNVEYRYFSGTKWDYAWTQLGWPVMCVGQGHLHGYLDRAMGDVIVPIETCGRRPDEYSDGYFTVTFDGAEHAVLLDMQGREVVFPEGVHAEAESVMRCGLVAVENEDGLMGYADAQGNIVIEPQYRFVMDFDGGFADVIHPESGFLLIDSEGRVAYESDADWSFHGVVDGSAFIHPVLGDPFLLNADGTVRMTAEMPAFAYAAWYQEPLVAGAPIRLQAGVVGNSYWCFVDENGQPVSKWWDRPAMFGWLCLDSLGWQAVTKVSGIPAWGYVDAWGKVVIPYQFHAAEDFLGALARVKLDASTEAYINRSGEVVYQWPVQEE